LQGRKQHRLHPGIAQGRAAQDGHDLALHGGPPQCRLQVVGGDGLLGEPALGQDIVGLGQRLDHGGAARRRLLPQALGDGPLADLAPQRGRIEGEVALSHQVHDAGEGLG
jgi:hypothetical protein